MNFKSTRKLKKAAACVLAGILALSIAPGAYAKKKDKKQGQQPVKQEAPKLGYDPKKLVWPAPPDIARIKWMDELVGEPAPPPDASGKPKKKKQGWMDRLAGVQTAEMSPTRNLLHALAKPYGVAVDSKGRVYVADSYVAAVFIFDLESKKVELIRNKVDAHFGTLLGLAMDDSDRLFVADASLHHIAVFDKDHKFETTFGDDDLGRPTGVAIDTENRLIYVVDTEKERVAVFDADTYKFKRAFGKSAPNGEDDPEYFGKPNNVAVDADGNVYVVDMMNNRVQIFDPDGEFISMFGKAGDAPGQFARPKGIGIDADGHIWVADAQLDRVQVFDKEGHLLAYFGAAGMKPGQFGLPTGLTVDKFNRVIVAEQLKGRIQVFRYVTNAEVAEQKKSGAPPAKSVQAETPATSSAKTAENAAKP